MPASCLISGIFFFWFESVQVLFMLSQSQWVQACDCRTLFPWNLTLRTFPLPLWHRSLRNLGVLFVYLMFIRFVILFVCLSFQRCEDNSDYISEPNLNSTFETHLHIHFFIFPIFYVPSLILPCSQLLWLAWHSDHIASWPPLGASPGRQKGLLGESWGAQQLVRILIFLVLAAIGRAFCCLSSP